MDDSVEDTRLKHVHAVTAGWLIGSIPTQTSRASAQSTLGWWVCWLVLLRTSLSLYLQASNVRA